MGTVEKFAEIKDYEKIVMKSLSSLILLQI